MPDLDGHKIINEDEKQIRLYNGPKSDEMDKLYDNLMLHIDLTELNDWPILSLYLARYIFNKSKCTCWKCIGLKEDPYKE